MEFQADLSDLNKLRALMTDVERRQLPWITALSLTRTAKAVQADLRSEMQSRFDRPTRWTLNGLYIKPATIKSPTAMVCFKDKLAMSGSGRPASVYLQPQASGGGRSLKAFEKALAFTNRLPSGAHYAPGAAAKLDAHGNITGGQITKILSALRVSRDASQNRGAGKGRGKRRNEQYVALGNGYGGYAGPLKPGVYLRDGRDLKPILMAIRAPQYKVRFPFDDLAMKGFATHWPSCVAATAFDVLFKPPG